MTRAGIRLSLNVRQLARSSSSCSVGLTLTRVERDAVRRGVLRVSLISTSIVLHAEVSSESADSDLSVFHAGIRAATGMRMRGQGMTKATGTTEKTTWATVPEPVPRSDPSTEPLSESATEPATELVSVLSSDLLREQMTEAMTEPLTEPRTLERSGRQSGQKTGQKTGR